MKTPLGVPHNSSQLENQLLGEFSTRKEIIIIKTKQKNEQEGNIIKNLSLLQDHRT